MFGVAFYWEWFHRYLKSIGSTRGSAGRIDSYADTKIVTFFIGHNRKILRGILECPSLCGFDPTLNNFQWQGTAEAFWWPRSSEFLSSPQLLVQQGTVRIWQRTAWWRLFCVFNILRKRKAPASYKQFFCYVQVTVSGSPWSKCAVLAPKGQNQTRQRRNSIYKPSLWAFLQTHGNTQPVGPQSCYWCCLREHDLGQGLSLLLILSRIWTEFSEAPCACYKGFKLNFFCNSKSWAMLCSPHLWWDGQVAPVPVPSRQASLMLSPRLAHHWQRVCLTPGTLGGPWKDTAALQHTQIPESCPSFAGRTAAWLKLARWYIYSPRWNYTQAIGAAGSFYFYLWM